MRLAVAVRGDQSDDIIYALRQRDKATAKKKKKQKLHLVCPTVV